MRLVKSALVFAGLIILVVIGLAIVVVTTDYVPGLIEEHGFVERNDESLGEEISITTFNIGYCGLDMNQDFFMDGGIGSRSSSENQTWINLNGNLAVMEELDTDILLIQEVDVDSTRSFHINEMEEIAQLTDYSYSFVYNYKVPWVPIPLKLPMGKAQSGLMTLTKSEIIKATRYDLPKDPTVPDKYFLLDRCIDEVVVPLQNGERLHVINLHLSAYDSAGVIKKEQMQWLREFILSRDLENEYYVFGGDWNQLLTNEIVIDRETYDPEWLGEAPTEFNDLPVTWAYDIATNTVRDLYEAYIPGHTFETVIDGFLVSDSIEVLEVETVNLGFEFSDHHPVRIKIRIK